MNITRRSSQDWGRSSATVTSAIRLYALDAGAVTAQILRETLSLNTTASIRAIEELRDLKIIYPALQIKRPHGAKGGPRVKVYQTPEASDDQIAKAVELQRRLESPKYCLALRYTQVLLEEYFESGNRGGDHLQRPSHRTQDT